MPAEFSFEYKTPGCIKVLASQSAEKPSEVDHQVRQYGRPHTLKIM